MFRIITKILVAVHDNNSPPFIEGGGVARQDGAVMRSDQDVAAQIEPAGLMPFEQSPQRIAPDVAGTVNLLITDVMIWDRLLANTEVVDLHVNPLALLAPATLLQQTVDAAVGAASQTIQVLPESDRYAAKATVPAQLVVSILRFTSAFVP